MSDGGKFDHLVDTLQVPDLEFRLGMTRRDKKA